MKAPPVVPDVEGDEYWQICGESLLARIYKPGAQGSFNCRVIKGA